MRSLSYPLSLIFFESMYSHVYDVKGLPWGVPFQMDYLREGGASFQIHSCVHVTRPNIESQNKLQELQQG